MLALACLLLGLSVGIVMGGYAGWNLGRWAEFSDQMAAREDQ